MSITNLISKKQRLEMTRVQLENERSSFIPHWRDLSDFIRPRRGRFFLGDVNKGDRRSQKILNGRATLSSRVLSSGMMGGISSPSRPWFNLGMNDPDLNDFPAVKQWLYKTTKVLSGIFLDSNFYNALPNIYGDLGDFATSAMMMEKDKEDVLRCRVFPVGSYCLAVNGRGRVNTFTRTFRMTAAQIVEEFGMMDNESGRIKWSNISSEVKTAFEASNYQQWFDIAHVIMPNFEYNPGKISGKYKRFMSCYYELNKGDRNNEVFLRESGYDYFPVMGPRWEVTGEDTYGTNCPGMTALGDVRGLQKMESKSLKAVDKMVDPPMIGPAEMEGVRTSILPSDITYFTEREGTKGFRAAHELNFRVDLLENKIEKQEARIREAYFHDLMLRFTLEQRSNVTAREVEEIGNEKFVVLGPVLEQLNDDLLDPAIDLAFMYALEAGKIPEAPEEIQGLKLKVEYVSIMAQAQKLLGLDGINRFLSTLIPIAKADPRVLNKINTYELVNEVAEITSVAPKIIFSDDEAISKEQAQQQAMQAQQQAQNAEMAASSAQKLSQAQVSDDNALGQVLQMAGRQ